jgi:hypothetical protein
MVASRHIVWPLRIKSNAARDLIAGSGMAHVVRQPPADRITTVK